MPSHALALAMALSLTAAVGVHATVPAHASTKSTKGLNLKPPAQAQKDDGSAARLLYQTKEPEAKAGGLKVSSICTDALGMTHKKGDAGYVGCLRTQDRLQPDTGKAKRTNSVGISIGD